MWLEDISEYMYYKCEIDDKEEYWSLITDDEYMYLH